jgi:hypothetical protein
MTTNTTTAKIAARIAAKVAEGMNFRDAVTAAAWDATTEAQEMGWSAQTIAGMWQTFATVAADMVAEAVAA